MAASLELAISAIRSGRKEEGRQLLNLLIQRNPNDDMAWLWMSSVVDTDEQRARCLYHVLAINPDSDLARRGLQVLGIVVSDSRPVKVPRDSQPIKIPKPSPQNQPQPLPPFQPESRPVPAQERRPFRIDPKAIVDELPFTPIKEPFSETMASEPETTAQPQPPNDPARPPSEPTPVVQAEAGANLNAQATAQLQTTGSLNLAGQPSSSPQESNPAAQPGFGEAGRPHDTRPSQPVPVAHSNTTVGMPQQMPYAGPWPGYQQQQPPYPSAPAVHSQMTMGMPTQYAQPYDPSQPAPAIHSQMTMGMPSPAPGQGYPPASPPPAPVPAVQPNAWYGQPQFQQPMLQSAGVHSSATMAMPAGYDPFAALRAGSGQDYRMATAARPGSKQNKPEEKDGEEINILAVIIFGSLSITAFGGLGMLILLMLTTG